MRNLILFILTFTMPMVLLAQSFTETKDVALSKDELFTATKEFVADISNNIKSSILNEDRDGGVIQLKYEYIDKIGVGMGLSYVYEYEYKIRIRMKDKKYKIDIYDIECVDANQVGLGTSYDIPLIPYFEDDNVPEKLKKSGRGINKKQAIKLRDNLNILFNDIFSQYNKFINTYEPF